MTVAKALEILNEQVKLISNQIDYGNQAIDAIQKSQIPLKEKLSKVIELKSKVETQMQ